MSTNSENKNFYEILGVPVDSSVDAIRKAWRISVRRNHPDRVPLDDQDAVNAAGIKMSKINEAYATLSKPERRKYYDLTVGIISAKCASCGNPGKLRLGENHQAVAVCDSCITWNNSFKL